MERGGRGFEESTERKQNKKEGMRSSAKRRRIRESVY